MLTVPESQPFQTHSVVERLFTGFGWKRGLRIAAVLAVTILFGLMASTLLASPPTTQTTLQTAWDEVDQRMVFFTVQLASVETSLDAVNKSLKSAGYKISVREGDAARYQKGNELMDRNAGGPVRWDEFYGRTAEKFFYNPAAPAGSLRLTTSVLKSNPFDERGQRPPDQRPPQFDYIYSANANASAQAQADVAKLAGHVDQLLARKKQLEDEQSSLWCKASFRPVAARELLRTPLYRFQIKTTDTSAMSAQHLQALTAAMDFLRANNTLIDMAEKSVDQNQAGYYATFETAVGSSRTSLDDSVIKAPDLVGDAFDVRTTLGKFEAVAKRMDDVAKNVDDAFKLSIDGQNAGDEVRKATFRGQLQASLVTYAEAVLAGDECVRQLADDWKILPDFHVPAVLPSAPILPPTDSSPQTGVHATNAERQPTATMAQPSSGSNIFDNNVPATTAPSPVTAIARDASRPSANPNENVLSGDQAADVVTLVAGQPYVLDGEYRVPKGKKLILDKGAKVICQPRSYLWVGGMLTVNGTAEQPVECVGYKPGPSNWKGIILDGPKGAEIKNLRVSDAEIGFYLYGGTAKLTQCVAVNNGIGISIGRYDSHEHSAVLNDCVMSFNKSHGLSVHDSKVSLTNCTLTRNEGIGIEGAYYPNLSIKKSIIALNESGGIQLATYDCAVDMSGSIIGGNKQFDVNNKSTPNWDLRGNYWGPEPTALLSKGTHLTSVEGTVRTDDFLTQMPTDCGSQTKELNGQKLY